MHYVFYLSPRVGPALEAVLLWRLLRKPTRSHYPYLIAFVAYSLVRDLALFPIFWYKPASFATVYWHAEMVASFLGFAVIWEFIRSVLPRQSGVHEIGRKVLWIIELCVLPLIILLAHSQALSSHYGYTYVSPVFVQYLSLVQVILLLGPTFVAWYYGVPVSRNVRGLGLGFGAYVALRSINFGNLQAFQDFFPWWQLLSPLTFLGMIAVWLWAFWNYTPSRKVAATGRIGYTRWVEHSPQVLRNSKREDV